MSPVTAAAALVGRDDELGLLDGLFREAARGRGCAVLVEGEPGIGKSTLAHAAVAAAPDAGCQVFWGVSDELGTALPLLPFLDALKVREPSASTRRKTIVGLLRGEIAADRGADVPAALAEQLLALVAEECAARPAVVVIDDLQWADPASVALWSRLARTASDMPLLLIGMARPVPQRDDLLVLRRAVSGRGRLRLAGLSEAAVADLLTALSGGRPDDGLLRLAEGAAGNPLYLTELIAALVRGSSLVVTAGGTAMLADGTGPSATDGGPVVRADGTDVTGRLGDGGLVGDGPAPLSAVIADRLGFLAGPVRDVLRAAALLGVDFEVADLAIVLDRTVPDLLPAIDEARAAGVLAESDATLGFRHPLIRAALYEEMPVPVRAAWHRDAARALADAGAPPERVARQLLCAAHGPGPAEAMDEGMLDWLVRTGDRLIGQAPSVAADLLAQAASGTPLGASHHDWLVTRLADALYRTADIARAAEVANQALDYVTDPDLLVDLHWTLAQCRIRTGQSAESLATLARALEAPGLSSRHRARLLVVAARTHDQFGEVETAGRVASEALAAATDASDTWAMGWALHVLALEKVVHGEMNDALVLFDKALTVTQADPALTDLRLLLQINKAVILSNLDRYEEAFVAARQARGLAGQVGTTVRLGQAHGALGQLLFETGQWDEALAEIASLPEDLKEPGGACCDLGIAAVISFHRGEIVEARGHLADAAPHDERFGHRLIGPLALARSLDREHAGALPDALAALTAGFDASTEDLEEFEDLFADAVRLALATGDLSVAKSLADEAAGLAEGSEILHRQANALYCRGLLDHDAERLLAAAARYADASRPLLAAKALEAAAAEFLRVDDRGLARDAFIQAVEAYTALGATADVARLRAAFRAHGIHRGPHSRHRRALSGWDSLTDTEVKVAGLVAEGLSNPEIASKLMLSRRTVSTHVSHILKKLGVASRTDIARESALRTVSPR
jgi:DNA-binding CsgD family transcriptional regulator/tetratricopeptide (TPR) repeat protein